MKQMPVRLILEPHTALLGAALCAMQAMQYG
jgi:glucokinase